MDSNSVQREVAALEKTIEEEGRDLERHQTDLRKKEAEVAKLRSELDKAESDLNSQKTTVARLVQQREGNERQLRRLADDLRKAIDFKK